MSSASSACRFSRRTMAVSPSSRVWRPMPAIMRETKSSGMASVTATIKSQTRGDKVTIFKYKRRKNYKRTAGHRQP